MNSAYLLTADTLAEAHMLKARLNNEGIECILTNENYTAIKPGIQRAGSGIEIRVDENDLEIAQQLLSEKFKSDNKKLVCRRCGSEKISVGFRQKPASFGLSIVLMIISGLTFGIYKPKYYCQNCKHKFS